MSAPDTNVEKQADKHKGPLRGIAFAMMWGLGLLVLLVVFLFLSGDDPVGADEQVDSRSGAVVEAD